jgi:hypothetical protein
MAAKVVFDRTTNDPRNRNFVSFGEMLEPVVVLLGQADG